jgi:hypothetical protein
MESTNKKIIAVVGATGQQGGGVVRALILPSIASLPTKSSKQT